MVINKTSEYDRNPKEACMMDFRTKEQLESVSEPRYIHTYEFLTNAILCCFLAF